LASTRSSYILANNFAPLSKALYFKYRVELIIKLLVLLLSILVASCAPVLRQYHEPQSDVGELHSKGCSGSGPNDTLKLNLRNDVSLKVWSYSEGRVENIETLYFIARFYIPENVTLKFIDTNAIVISKGLANVNIPIKSLSRFIGIGNTEVKPIEDSFIGSTKIIKRLFNEWPAHRIYKLEFSLKLNSFLDEYSIKLPAFSINGKKVDAPKLEFKYVEKMGVDPLNC
jgi:hypothetical protein